MIEFTITFTENPKAKLMELRSETKDAPDATKAEITVANNFEQMVAAFKEHMTVQGRKPSVPMPKNRIISQN